MLRSPSRRGRMPGAAGGPWLRALLGRAQPEEGVAVPAVIGLIAIGLAISGAAVVASTNALSGSVRDERSKDALAAADAGAQLALFRQNMVDTNLSNPCVVASEVGGDLVSGKPAADGWCPAVNGQVGDAGYTYRVSPATVAGNDKRAAIVATGSSEGVSRRIEVDASARLTNTIFADFSVISQDWIHLDSKAVINGDTATNGGVSLSANAQICGQAQVAPGETISPDPWPCKQGETLQGTVDLPPVDTSLLATATSTSRFFAPDVPGGDSISGSGGNCPPPLLGRASVCWDANNRRLTLTSNSALTMGGGEIAPGENGTYDYLICELVMDQNSTLFVAQGSTVRIFFDRPENCPGLPADGTQLRMSSNTRVSPTSGVSEDLQFIMLGSALTPPDPCRIEMNSNADTTMPLVLYAPLCALHMDSNSVYIGAIAAASVDLDSNARIQSDASVNDFSLPVRLHYRQDRYVECSQAPLTPESAPNAYC
jgi:hypothetical protein